MNSMLYMKPDSLYQKYVGEEFAFQRITLPEPTAACESARRNDADRCSDDETLRLGDPVGTCDEAPESLQKVMSKVLRDVTMNPSVPEALHSPAHHVLRDFSITDLQVGEMFSMWADRTIDPWNFGSRDIVCDWIVDNMEFIESFIPPTYPRVVQEIHPGPWFYGPGILGGVATVAVLGTMLQVMRMRSLRIMRFSQVEFMVMVLYGFLMVAVGAIVVAAPATDGSCVAQIWLIGLGYTLELVPLIVKVDAINRIVRASRSLRFVRVKKRSLYGAVILISFLEVIFLILWSALDTPHKKGEYELTDAIDSDSGSYVVEVRYYCDTGATYWELINVCWNALLLLIATVLAFQMRNAIDDLNESRTLAFMIYSHFVFVLLRLATLLLSSHLSEWILERMQSIIFSIDTLVALCTYFVPKFFMASWAEDRPSLSFTRQTSRTASPLPMPFRHVAEFVSNLSVNLFGSDEDSIDEQHSLPEIGDSNVETSMDDHSRAEDTGPGAPESPTRNSSDEIKSLRLEIASLRSMLKKESESSGKSSNTA